MVRHFYTDRDLYWCGQGPQAFMEKGLVSG